jgi:hypothetical protein
MTKPQIKSAPLTKKSDTTPVKVKVKCPTVDEIVISYDASADKTTMTATAIKTLKEICSKACISSVKITSTARTAKDQARVMYDMIEAKGAKYAKNLYGANGKKVVEVYEASKKKKLSADDTKQAMLDKINELGPSNVSHHVVSGDGKICVFDVAPSSIADAEAKKRFVKETKAHASVGKFYEPPADPAYHLEVTN